MPPPGHGALHTASTALARQEMGTLAHRVPAGLAIRSRLNVEKPRESHQERGSKLEKESGNSTSGYMLTGAASRDSDRCLYSPCSGQHSSQLPQGARKVSTHGWMRGHTQHGAYTLTHTHTHTHNGILCSLKKAGSSDHATI